MNGKIIDGIGLVAATLFVMSLATTNVHAAKPQYCFTAIVHDPIVGDVEQFFCSDSKKACEQQFSNTADTVQPCHKR